MPRRVKEHPDLLLPEGRGEVLAKEPIKLLEAPLPECGAARVGVASNEARDRTEPRDVEQVDAHG